MNAPVEAFRCQALAKEIAAELRAKFDLNTRDRAQYEDRQGAWPRCADIDPAERGRVDRIGIPQRKKTGSPTAAMGQSRRFAHATGTSALAPTPDVLRRRSEATLRARRRHDAISRCRLILVRQGFHDLARAVDEELHPRRERAVLQRHDSDRPRHWRENAVIRGQKTPINRQSRRMP
jgi:hypothetical protein